MKSFLTLLFVVMSIHSEASIVCHTPRMNKIFEVNGKKITFFNEFGSQNKRELASVLAKTKSNDKGVTNTVSFENQKHIIHIADENALSDLNDYIIIKSRNGHEVTYPLTCEKK